MSTYGFTKEQRQGVIDCARAIMASRNEGANVRTVYTAVNAACDVILPKDVSILARQTCFDNAAQHLLAEGFLKEQASGGEMVAVVKAGQPLEVIPSRYTDQGYVECTCKICVERRRTKAGQAANIRDPFTHSGEPG